MGAHTPNAPLFTPNTTLAVLGEIIFLSPVPGTNELFLLHFPMVYCPLLSLLCLHGCSSALPASEGLGMLIFRSFILVTCLVLGFTQQQLKKKNYQVSKSIYAAILNRSILCMKLKASLHCKTEWPVISIP